MKKTLLIIVTAIVILGMVAGYIFRGVAPTTPTPAFKGPTGQPYVNGPTTPPPVQ